MTPLERGRKWAKANAAKKYAINRRWFLANPEARIYGGIRHRCNNPAAHNYRNYGGRGIRCMYESYAAFLADVGRRPGPGTVYSIDRINNDGHYEPGNCRWATLQQQHNNTRRNKHGITRTSS